MAVLQLRSALTSDERQLRQKLILRDTIALSSLFGVTIVLFFITLLLFHSFSVHRDELKQRWIARGESALKAGQANAAVESLRSALAYAPADKNLEIELARALAAAGRTDEAVVYFNTLLESMPGDGMIHLELARLAVRQGEEARALDHYRAALDGTWEGHGYDRRREIRLELALYLIALKQDNKARAQLLIAAENAPDDAEIEIQIAGLLETAQDPANALHVYEKALLHKPTRLAALQGASRTAYALGKYQVAKQYLERTLNHSGFGKLSVDQQAQYRNLLANSDHLLLLYPGPDLSVRARAERVLAIRKIAQDRLASCVGRKTAVPAPLQTLANQWQQLPRNIRLFQLEENPELEGTIMQLAYQTEQVTSQQCGMPTGNDALLLMIARNPVTVEQE